LLLKNQSRDWFGSLEANEKDSYEHLLAAFKKRYQQSDLIKYKSARDIFTRKQGKDESVDDYVTAMKQMARKISATPDENMTRFAILAGLQPHIANFVVAKAPQNIPKLLEEARIAELTSPSPAPDSLAIQQLTAEVKRLSQKLDRSTTSSITGERRTPTPERRRVSFSAQRPLTPPPPPAGALRNQYDRRGNAEAPSRGFVQRGRYTQRGANRGLESPRAYQARGFGANPCDRCGYNAHVQGELCPALRDGKTCNICRRPGHFSRQCRSAMRGQQQQQQQNQ
jgi:hypothetical protein